MRRDTMRVMLLSLIATATLIVACLLAGCGGNSPAAGGTGALTMRIIWPAVSTTSNVTPAAIPAATQCIQITLTQGLSKRVVAVKRPAAETTSDVTVTDVHVGPVHVHVGAYDNYTEDALGNVQASGNMLAWAVTDTTVAANATTQVRVTLGATPATVVVSAGGASTILNVDDSLDLAATAYDSEGNILLVTGFTWTSSADTIATVDTSGRVTARSPGRTTITATVSGVSGSLDVRVRGWELWDTTPSAGAYRTIVYNGKIYCFGPIAHSVPTKQWYVYTPGAKTWQAAPDLPVERFAPALGVIGGKIYLAETYGEGVSTTYEIDPVTLAVTAKAPMPTGVSGPAATAFDGKLWLIGGVDAVNGASSVVQTYDPATNAWVTMNSFPVAGSMGSAAVFGGSLYVCGIGPTSTPTDEVYRRHASGDIWEPATRLTKSRTALSLGLSATHLLAMGGSALSAPLGTTAVEAFNGSLWQPAPPVPEPLIPWNSGGQAMVDDYLYVVGGATGSTDSSNVYRLWVGSGAL